MWGLGLKEEEKGKGMPKKKRVTRKKMIERDRAMVKKLVKMKLIRAVRLRCFLVESFDLGVTDGRKERAHVVLPRRVLKM